MQEKLVQVQVYLPAKRVATLRALARDRGESLSNLCKHPINQFLDAHNQRLHHDAESYIMQQELKQG